MPTQPTIFALIEQWLNYPLLSIGANVLRPAAILRVIAILAIGWWLAHLIGRLIARFSQGSTRINASSVYTFSRVIQYFITALFVVVAASSAGLDLQALTVIAGALGIGVGFGLQTIVHNFVSGIILLFERTIKVGDLIELENGLVGHVREISVRYTRINTNDNLDIIIPNSTFTNGNVINWSFEEPIRRIHIPFGVAYGSDRSKVRAAVVSAAEALPQTISGGGRDTQVWLTGFGDSSLDFELVVWVNAASLARHGRTRAEYMWAIADALDLAGIEIPFPQRDLHVKSGAIRIGDGTVRFEPTSGR